MSLQVLTLVLSPLLVFPDSVWEALTLLGVPSGFGTHTLCSLQAPQAFPSVFIPLLQNTSIFHGLWFGLSIAPASSVGRDLPSSFCIKLGVQQNSDID